MYEVEMPKVFTQEKIECVISVDDILIFINKWQIKMKIMGKIFIVISCVIGHYVYHRFIYIHISKTTFKS